MSWCTRNHPFQYKKWVARHAGVVGNEGRLFRWALTDRLCPLSPAVLKINVVLANFGDGCAQDHLAFAHYLRCDKGHRLTGTMNNALDDHFGRLCIRFAAR